MTRCVGVGVHVNVCLLSQEENQRGISWKPKENGAVDSVKLCCQVGKYAEITIGLGTVEVIYNWQEQFYWNNMGQKPH